MSLLLTQPAIADGFKRPWLSRGPNLVERLERDGRFETLLTALELTGLKETLATAGPLTLIAPTDDAFATVPAETLEALIGDPEALKQILLYHVAGGSLSSHDLYRQTTVETLEGNPVLVTWNHRTLEVNGLPITRANVRASNGLLHIIEAGVLLPPAEPITVNSLVDVLRLDGRFTTLLTAVELAGLGEALVSSPSLTLFAPTDEAFAALPSETLDAVLADPALLTQVLLYHVIGEKENVFDLLRQRSTTTLQGQSVEAQFRGGKIKINDSIVINPNLNAPNGIIHVIDQVLIPDLEAPSADLVDLLEQDGRFTTLLTAVQAAGLVDVLRSEGPFTVLAPTDEAFARLPAQALQDLLSNTEALQQVLLYHVIAGENSLEELRSERSVETVQGADVKIRTWWRWTMINQAWVIDSDLTASNGVAHVLNEVLIPPAR